MFGFNRTKESFIKSLKTGDIVKQSHSLVFGGRQDVLFEFGHYGEATTDIFWQTAIVVMSSVPSGDYVTHTGVCRHDKIYEQHFHCRLDDCGKIRYATKDEIKRFEDAYDTYMTRCYHEGKAQRDDFTLRKRADGRLTMLQLLIDPPTYVYVDCGDCGEFIFKSAGLNYTSGTKSKIMYKEMLLADDRPCVHSNSEEAYSICQYNEAIEVREATETEIKLLRLSCDEKRKSDALKEEQEIKNQEKLKKMTYCEMLDVPIGTMIYAKQGFTQYIFPLGRFKRIEGNEIMYCKDGSVKIDGELHYTSFTEGEHSLYTCDSFKILRLADDEEITTYNQKKQEYMEQKNKIYPAALKKLLPGTLLYVKTKIDDTAEYLVPFKELRDDGAIIYCIGYLVKDRDTHGKWKYYTLSNDQFSTYGNCSEIREATEEEKYVFMTNYETRTSVLTLKELRTFPKGAMLVFFYDNKTYGYPNGTTYTIFEFDGIYSAASICFKNAISFVHTNEDNQDDVEINMKSSMEYNGYINHQCVISRRAYWNEVLDYKKYIKHGTPGMCVSYQKKFLDDLIANIDVNEKKRQVAESRLRPFVTKVLVSDGLGDVWRPAIFGGIAKRDKRYMVVGGMLFKYCVPFSRHRDWLGKEFAASDVPTTPGFVTKSVTSQET